MTERIQSVDRAIDLLLAVAAAGPTDAGVPALAKACGLNRATAWRLLKTLQARGLVTVDGGGHYALGVTAVELGGAAGPDALIAAAHPVLERTSERTGETASLAMPAVGGLTYVDEVTPTAVLTASWLGRAVPLHATSTGKALLAFLPPGELRRVLPMTLPAFTDTTITSPPSSTPSWPPPAPAATAPARANWNLRCTGCRRRCSTAPAARWPCCPSGGRGTGCPSRRSPCWDRSSSRPPRRSPARPRAAATTGRTTLRSWRDGGGALSPVLAVAPLPGRHTATATVAPRTTAVTGRLGV